MYNICKKKAFLKMTTWVVAFVKTFLLTQRVCTLFQNAFNNCYWFGELREVLKTVFTVIRVLSKFSIDVP